jgi:hypothetical protein
VVNFTPQPHHPQGRALVPFEQETGWAPEPIWTLWKRDTPLTLAKNRTPIPWFSSPYSSRYDGLNCVCRTLHTYFVFYKLHTQKGKMVYVDIQLESSACGCTEVSAHGSVFGGGHQHFLLRILTPYRSRNPRLTTVGIRCADHAIPSIRKSWHYFANKRRSLGRHSSLADQSQGV